MNKTETYVRGMTAINNFYSMLYAAMRESMPEAQLSSSGAYVWRGYRIASYKNLAYGQYYCQIYPGPQQFLYFQEGYQDPKHHASDFEKKHEIMQGRYYYPFSEKLDLVHTRFFDFDKNEQYATLLNFVTRAVDQALIWQQSEAREKVTGIKFQQGKKPKLVPVRVKLEFERIELEFLQAWDFQAEIFAKLKPILESIPGKESVRENSSIHNFEFRGFRLKLADKKDTSRWSIYFNDFGRIRFHYPKGKPVFYNLLENNYFDLSASEQESQLWHFAQSRLSQKI